MFKLINNSIFKVYPPQFLELPSPLMELFDLDHVFGSEKILLAQSALKYTGLDTNGQVEDHIRQFIVNSNEILSIDNCSNDCKNIIEKVFQIIDDYKKNV